MSTNSVASGSSTWTPAQLSTILGGIQTSATWNRVGRLLLTPTPGGGNEVDWVPAYKFKDDSIEIDPAQPPLAPAEISKEFSLALSEVSGNTLLTMKASRAASWIANAEDAVILLGESWTKGGIGNVTVTNEEKQVGLLPEGYKPLAKPTPDSLLDSISAGMRQLRHNHENGPYCVIVDPSLYQVASKYMNAGDTVLTLIGPQLQPNGFQYSPALPPNTGLIFSLGGETIDLLVPYDLHLSLLNTEVGAKFRIAEQIRLRINDPKAIVALANPVST